MGRIAIEGMQFYAYHGRYHEEQVIGNQFLVDVYVETDVTEAAASDSLESTIDYEQIYAMTKEEMKEKSYLLEHVGQRIMDRIWDRFENMDYVMVRVSKLHPAVKGNVDRVYVELERRN
jgi:dihydroneopterin aldolase